MIRRIGLGALALAFLALTGSPALAKGHNAPVASTIALTQSNPYLGEQITFSFTYPTSVKHPRIQVICYQGSALVYGEAGTADHVFTLGGGASVWLTNGGSAYCEADLFNLVWNGNNQQQVTMLAETGFTAAGSAG